MPSSTFTALGRSALLSVLAVAFGAIDLAPPLAASRSITMEDVIALKGANPRDLSFDGDGLLGDVDAGAGRPDEIAGAREIVRWSGGQSRALGMGRAPSRSPDGRWLIFARDRTWILKDEHTGKVRIYDAGRQISAFNGAPVWSRDSRFVAVNYDLQGESIFRADEPVTVAPGVRAVVFDQRDGAPAPSSLQIHPQLLAWDVRQPEPFVQATGGHGAYTGDWRVDGRGHDYFYAVGQEGGAGLEAYTIVKVLHAESRAERTLYKLPSFNQNLRPQLSPDQRRLAFVADPDAPAFGVSDRVMLLDLADNKVRTLAPMMQVTALRWGADGRIYVLRQDGGLQQLCSIGTGGDALDLTHDAISRRGLAHSQDGRTMGYAAQDGYGRLELRTWRLDQRREQRQAVLSTPPSDVTLGSFAPVGWTTPDGLRLHGYVVYPPNFDPHRRYPLLVDLHGGGPGQALGFLGLFGVRANTPLDWHAWAALGYVVFVPDFRSAGEYGSAVNLRLANASEDIDGSRQDADDAASGVRWMRDKPFIDATRIAGIGHSAGGPRLASLLMRTSLFSAAILDDPVPFGPDGLMLSGVKYGGAALWTRAKLPPSDQDKLGADDLFDGWRVTTPTLIMVGDQTHGALDPLSAETLYAMLLSTGTPTRFVHFVDDGHIPLSDASYRAHYEEIVHWLDRYAPPGGVEKRASQPLTQSSIAAAR